jgi:hypothetical protein
MAPAATVIHRDRSRCLRLGRVVTDWHHAAMTTPAAGNPPAPRLRVVEARARTASVTPTQVTAAPPAPPSHRETILALLTQSRRETLPLRKAFVQQPPGSSSRVGPLADFVTRHDDRALCAYLFLHALASGGDWTCTYPSETWARVLNLSETCDDASAKAAVSKVLKRLEDRKLISRRRVGRRTEITLLLEDGSGEPYTRPRRATDGLWFHLPYAFWRDGHYARLTVPAKTMLLIGLSLDDEFVLPHERMRDWYGVSADTAARGLAELRAADLLATRDEYVHDFKSAIGWRQVQHHRLLPPYDTTSRAIAAKAAVARRRSGSSSPADEDDALPSRVAASVDEEVGTGT